MGQFQKAVTHKDRIQDHIHSVPNKEGDTGTMLNKPNSLHAHLYQFDGKTLETSDEPNDPYHVHKTEVGETSGPKAPVDHDAPARKEFQPKNMFGVTKNGPNSR